jgi:predicted ATPase
MKAERLKILLAGTTSSGKTTVINELEKRKFLLPTEKQRQVFIGHERARMRLEENADFFSNPAFQQILHQDQLQLEAQARTEGAVVSIFDSGIPVNLGYAALLQSGLTAQTVAEWQTLSQSYTKVYLLNKDDISFTLTELHKKTTDEDWPALRQAIHQAILSSLAECGLAFELLEGSVAQRTNTVWAKVLAVLEEKDKGE